MFGRLATLATGLVISTSIHASDAPWYEVEVYLFSHPTTSTEQWPDSVTPIETQGSVDFIAPLIKTDINAASLDQAGCTANDWAFNPSYCQQQISQPSGSHLKHVPVTIAADTEQVASTQLPHVLLAKSQSQFANYIASIEREPAHQSLLHMTWQQPMLPRHSAKAVRIIGGKDFSEQFQMDGRIVSHSVDVQALSEYGALVDDIVPASPKQVWQLDGKINIYLNHYLYIETALNYREAGRKALPLTHNLQTLEDQQFESAHVTDTEFLYATPMIQNRRVRSGEVHYLDHPKLGMIVQIRKMPQPKAEVSGSMSTAQPIEPVPEASNSQPKTTK